MAVDDRIKFLVREEVQRILAEADLGASPDSLGLDDLHTEIHALATRVSKLEDRISDPSGTSAPDQGPRTRTRKAAGE